MAVLSSRPLRGPLPGLRLPGLRLPGLPLPGLPLPGLPLLVAALVACPLANGLTSVAVAQVPRADGGSTEGGRPAVGGSALGDRQAGVSKRYQRLEDLLLKLAEVEASEKPERAALLRRAAKLSRDKLVLKRLRTASEALGGQQYAKAIENQEAAAEDLAALLKLLRSEDRSKRIRDEKERYRRLIKELKRTLNNQRGTRARTENGADLDEVKREQESVTKKSDKLREELSEENDGGQQSSTDSSTEGSGSESESNSESESDSGSESQPSESQPSESSPSESQPSESQPSRSSPSESQPSESQPSESQPSESQPSESQPSESQPSESSPSESSPSPDSQSPPSAEEQVEQQLEKAIERMRQAQRQLDQAKREEATEQQRQAEEKLRAAIDRLERILRQLREEEMQRELARLEARLKKMAAMQSTVLEKTVALAATPVSQRDRQTDLKAGNLSFEEKKITLEADRAMLLLREEGSSVAFPEVVSQIRDDTTRVAELLGRSKVDAVCQGIQQDILAALEEMIAALQQAQRDLEQQQQENQPGQSGQPGQGEQPLVETIAEMKLIRTMQTRIKKTTERYSTLLESGDSASGELVPLLRDLAGRQGRLYQITRDLVMKRNQ